MAKLQAASALGQARLQAAWEDALGAHGIPAAQILLAAGDVADRTAYVNARQAFAELFRLGAVPVVNENDATATDEITFGDNDALAAQVAVLVRAGVLVLLTEVEGVYSRAPGTPRAPSCSSRARSPPRPRSGAARSSDAEGWGARCSPRRWRAQPASRR